MTHLLYPLFVFVILSFSSCKKNNSTKNAVLPPATQEGKNTVGFTVGNEVWIPYSKCKYFGNPCREISARYGESGGAPPNSIAFQFVRERNDKASSLSISGVFATVTGVGEKIDSLSVIYTGENWTGNTDTYSGIGLGSHFIITKFDGQAQIISGTFELILTEDNRSGKTVHLKEGRFDFEFNYCQCSN